MDISVYIRPEENNNPLAVKLVKEFININADEFFYLSLLSISEYKDLVGDRKCDGMYNDTHVSLINTLAQIDTSKSITENLCAVYKLFIPNTIFSMQFLNIFLPVLMSTEVFNMEIDNNKESISLNNNIAVDVLYILTYKSLPSDMEDYIVASEFNDVLHFTDVLKTIRTKGSSRMYDKGHVYLLHDIYKELMSRKLSLVANKFLSMYKYWFEKFEDNFYIQDKPLVDFMLLGLNCNLVQEVDQLAFLAQLSKQATLFHSLDILDSYINKCKLDTLNILKYLNSIERKILFDEIVIDENCNSMLMCLIAIFKDNKLVIEVLEHLNSLISGAIDVKAV